MKKLTFWKSLFLLCALIVGSSSAWADDEITINWNDSFTPALPTKSANANTEVTSHTVNGLSIKEKKIYIGTYNSISYLMFIQDEGYLYNTESLGTIKSVSVTYSSGCSTSAKSGVYFGSSEMSTYTKTSNKTIKGTSQTDTWENTTEGYGFFQLSTSNKNCQIVSIEITYVSDTGEATTVTIDDTGITNTDIASGAAAGSFSAVVRDATSNIIDGSVTWTSSNTNVATIDNATGAVTLGRKGKTTITANYAGVTDTYKPSQASYELTVINSNANDGSSTKPFTVAEAIDFITDLGEGHNTGVDEYHTHGIVSYVGSVNSDGQLSYRITEDGVDDEDNCLNVYQSKYLENADFTDGNKLQVGDEVTVKGQLENYYSTPYSNEGYLTYFKRKADSELAFGGETNKSVTLTKGDDLTGVGFTKADGINLSDITFSASYNDVASVNSSGVITLGGNTGTSVITATFAGNEDYKEGKATCTITVNPSEVVVEPEAGGYYQKVMSNDDLATGKYLIVYESGNVAFKSSLTTLDATNNNFAVTISDNKIAVSDQTTANEVTIDVTNNSIKAANGNYIGRTNGTSNGLYESTTPQAHTITVSSGAATIYCLGSNGTTKLYLKFNNDTNQKRFRYFTTSGTIQLYKLVAGNAPNQIDIQVSEAGFATYVSNFDLDYSTCDDLKAYIAKEENGEIKFTEVEKVPANTGVLLRATDGGGKKYTVETTTETDDMTGNKLVRGTGAAVATGTNPYNYILNVVNNELGFYRANNQTVATNRAYLQTSVTPGALAKIAIIFDDATTAINGIEEVAPVNVKTRKVVKNGRLVIETANGEFTIDGARVK